MSRPSSVRFAELYYRHFLGDMCWIVSVSNYGWEFRGKNLQNLRRHALSVTPMQRLLVGSEIGAAAISARTRISVRPAKVKWSTRNAVLQHHLKLDVCFRWGCGPSWILHFSFAAGSECSGYSTGWPLFFLFQIWRFSQHITIAFRHTCFLVE